MMPKSSMLAAALLLPLSFGTAIAGPKPPDGWGALSGPLVQATDEIDPTLTVCAERIGSRETRCTTHHIRSRSGSRYWLALPPGEYHVYAMTPDCTGWRAYYTEFVRCGLHVKCSSHARIPVSVSPGSIRNDVSPADWYDVPPSKKNACDP